jgi:hypothetical protein
MDGACNDEEEAKLCAYRIVSDVKNEVDPGHIHHLKGGGAPYNFSINNEGGVKHDEGKLRYDLIPPEALEALCAVLGYGAEKYSQRNWEKGIADSRLFAAAQRHLWAAHGGELLDPESGFPHDWHAFCNIAMKIALDKRAEHA